MRRIQTVLLALSALALGQCASGPASGVRIGTESKVAVYYDQPRQGLRQAILGEKIVDPRDFYSDPKSDKLAKVASNAQLQVLLDGLAECNFFSSAAAQAEPDALSTILVQIDGVQHAWSLTLRTPTASLQDYTQALAWFQNVYNGIDSFHTGNGNFDPQAEIDRIRKDNDARRSGRKERP